MGGGIESREYVPTYCIYYLRERIMSGKDKNKDQRYGHETGILRHTSHDFTK
jgi:hypothetical protein